MPEVIELESGSVLTPIALIDKDGLVILFHESRAGTVIQSDGHHPIGHFSNSWNMEYLDLKPFKGTITMNFA